MDNKVMASSSEKVWQIVINSGVCDDLRALLKLLLGFVAHFQKHILTKSLMKFAKNTQDKLAAKF